MPLSKLVLILTSVIVAAGATIWLASLFAASVNLPFGWAVLIPAALVAVLVWRFVATKWRADDRAP